MIRLAICDDDVNTLECVGRMAREYAGLNPQWGIAVHQFRSAYDLLRNENREPGFHIYLMDIMMPGVNGIDAAQRIRRMDEEAVIVFMTAGEEFALESFKASPLSYLVKPIREGTLFPVLEKACQRVQKAADDYVMVRVKSGTALIRYHQIVFIEYMNHTMTYHLTTGKTLTTMVLRESFTDFTEKYLRDPRFIKPHASFVLNMDQVQVMSAKEFEMVGGEVVPVSKRAYAQVRKQFMDYILLRHGGLAQ